MTNRCMLCGRTSFSCWFERPPHRVIQCDSCRLVTVDPKPTREQLRELYQQSYFQSPSATDSGYQDYLGEWDNHLRTFRKRYRRIRRFLCTSDAVLEIGMACGAFLKVLLEEGFTNLHGVDLSEFAVNQAAARLEGNADLRVGDLASQSFDRRFDVVFMWDVVEHVLDPLTELRRVHAVMKPGARLVLETQDSGSLFARVSGLRWHMFKFPEHLYHFDRRTIRMLLRKAGFRVALITKRTAGKYVSGDFLRERSGRYGWPLRALVKLRLGRRRRLYVNPFDEMIVIARRGGPDHQAAGVATDPRCTPIAASTQSGPSTGRQ